MRIDAIQGARPHRTHRLSRLEVGAAVAFVALLVVLVALEPDILQAPFESTRAVLLTFGGAVAVVVATVVMIRLGIRPIVRLVVVGVPVLAVSTWVLAPFFLNERVYEDFATSIETERARSAGSAPPGGGGADAASSSSTSPAGPPAPVGPKLLGSGEFVGLAGHDGTGDAGIFRLEDDSLVVRLENLDIDNGPDLELYLVPGMESYSPGDGSVHLGHLKGNIGDQTYEVPRDYQVPPGAWTVLVWCEAFTVEFVGASLTVV